MDKLDHNVAVRVKGMTKEQYEKIVEIMDISCPCAFETVMKKDYIEFWKCNQGYQQVDAIDAYDLERVTSEFITAEEFINKYGNQEDNIMNIKQNPNTSSIKFEFEDAPSDLTFGDVEEDQFFVDEDGWLCQKAAEDAYTAIANADGEPTCTFFDGIDSDLLIKRILPKVTKINF
jgi:hypothetical protein